MQPQPVGARLPGQPRADRGVDPRGEGGGRAVPLRAGARGERLRLRGPLLRGGHGAALLAEPRGAAAGRADARHPVRRRDAGGPPQRALQLPRLPPRLEGRAHPAEALLLRRRQLPRDALVHRVAARARRRGLRAARDDPRDLRPGGVPARLRGDRDGRHRRRLGDLRGTFHAALAAHSARRSTASRSSRTARARTTSCASSTSGST